MPTPREAYDNTVQRQGFTGARVQAADFGAAGAILGKAAQGFGQDLKEVGKNVQKIQEQDAETLAQHADNQRNALRQEKLATFKQLQGQAALDAHPVLLKELADIDRTVGDETIKGNGLARSMYNSVGERRTADDMGSITTHVVTQREVHRKAVVDTTAQMSIQLARTATDPTVVENNIATVGNLAVAEVMRSHNYDPAAIQLARQAGEGKVIAARAEEIARSSATKAVAFVNEYVNQGRMNPADSGKLLDILAPAADKAFGRAGWQAYDHDPGAGPGSAAAEGETKPYYPERGATAAAQPATAQPKLDQALYTSLLYQESKGKHLTNGRLTLSYNGSSVGISQLHKANIAPGSKGFGYGVVGPKDNSEAEFKRVGWDVLQAYTKVLGGNVVRGLTAYNWGIGKVQKHLRKLGGNPTDAEFVNSIPDRDAKKYASQILGRVGVQVSGSAYTAATEGGAGGGAAGPPAVFNLQRVMQNILADKSITDRQRDALISGAQEAHGWAKGAEAEARNTATEAAWEEINGLPKFTNITQLSVSTQAALRDSPAQWAQFNSMAESNREGQEAQYNAQKKATYEAKLAVLEQDLMAFSWNKPAEFQKIDFYGSPKWAKMGTAKVSEWMKRQQASIESAAGKGANHDSIRTMVNNFTTTTMKKDDKKMGHIYQMVINSEERMLNDPNRKGQPLTDTERQALVIEATTKATYIVDGTKHKGTRAEARAAGATSSQVDVYDYARGRLQRSLRRIPRPEEVEEAVQLYRRSQGKD